MSTSGENNAGLSASIERHLRAYDSALGNAEPSPGLYGRVVREVERPLLAFALRRCKGNQLKAAALLGLNRNTLRKKLTALGLAQTRDKPRQKGGK